MLKLVSRESFCDESPKAPGRKSNKEYRSREHLTSEEVMSLRRAARSNRHPVRDELMILMAYKHGLRVAELTGMKWEQIDLKKGEIHVSRKKNGSDATHRMSADEIALLRKLRKETSGPYLFVSERGQMTRFAFNQMLSTAGKKAGLEIKVHPHMLRHAAGYEMAKANVPTRTIQQYLGHKNIQHTAHYTALAPGAFKGIEDILR